MAKILNEQVFEEDTGKHYRVEYHGVKFDPYRICKIYDVTEPAAQQILKKVLCPGDRGAKSLRRDVQEIITAAERWIEMLDEDSPKVLNGDTQTALEKQTEDIRKAREKISMRGLSGQQMKNKQAPGDE